MQAAMAFYNKEIVEFSNMNSSDKSPAMAPPAPTVLGVQGKRALLTGVADDFGFHVAITLAQQGCRLVVAGDAAELRDLSTRISVHPDSEDKSRLLGVQLVEFDLTAGAKSVDAAIGKAWEAHGGLDAYLNCAAYTGPLTLFLDTNEDELRQIVDLNFKRVCLVSKAVGIRMRDTRTEGSIIFITSIIGTERGLFPGMAIPSASLAAVNHLTRAIAMELGKYKIRVNAVARGLLDSDLLLKSMSGEERAKEGKRVVPLQRWLDGRKDVSSILLYLVGDASSFLTGTVIFVDGGQSLTRARLRSYI